MEEIDADISDIITDIYTLEFVMLRRNGEVQLSSHSFGLTVLS